ncbi:hypothetical protein D8I24_0517 (plasmid) [Cupriavidus necator H850]|nr:hypothetical protein D8I24_0517 [Cupriavidus necator H850]
MVFAVDVSPGANVVLLFCTDKYKRKPALAQPLFLGLFSHKKLGDSKAALSGRALGKPLLSPTHEDPLAYERFLAAPQPAARWVLTGSKKLTRSHPDWHPFAEPSSSRRRQCAPGDGHPECPLRLACPKPATWLATRSRLPAAGARPRSRASRAPDS